MTQDDPAFGDLCREITEFYVNDDLKPGVLTSFISSDDGSEDKWYVAIHRFPFTGNRRDRRVVVCNATRASFGLAILEVYRTWMQIRDVNYQEEVENINHLI